MTLYTPDPQDPSPLDGASEDDADDGAPCPCCPECWGGRDVGCVEGGACLCHGAEATRR